MASEPDYTCRQHPVATRRRALRRTAHNRRARRGCGTRWAAVTMGGMKPDKQTLHFAGRVISVTTDEVVLPNGHRALLEVVHHPGGAAAVALDEHGRVCLLRQYRYVADGWLWELPAGKLEPNEPALLTPARGVIREAGGGGGGRAGVGIFA